MLDPQRVTEQPVETTILSLSSEVPAPDNDSNRRSGERHMTLYRVGSFQRAGTRELCLIRNISAGGMMIRLYGSLEPGEELSVELKCGEPIGGKVSWTRDEFAGIAFHQPIDVIDILSASQSGPKPRMPRVETSGSATLRDGAFQRRVTLCDISQGGAKLKCTDVVERGASLVLSIPGVEPIAGVACWVNDDHLGMSFNRPMSLKQLVEFLKGRQSDQRLSA